MAEAVSKAKSKKERGQNKVVLDVADLFAGNDFQQLGHLISSALVTAMSFPSLQIGFNLFHSLLTFFFSWTR